jgi:hypothetical protein
MHIIIVGEPGEGKTTLASEIQALLNSLHVPVVQEDPDVLAEMKKPRSEDVPTLHEKRLHALLDVCMGVQIQTIPKPLAGGGISDALEHVSTKLILTPPIRKMLRSIAGVTYCARCGMPPAYEGAKFCGAACSAQWEAGDKGL